MSKINAKNLVHPYYRLSEAAAILECAEADLLRLAATSRLELITPNLPERPFTARAQAIVIKPNDTTVEFDQFDLMLGAEDSFTFFVVPSLTCANIDLCGSGQFSEFYGAYILLTFSGVCPVLFDMREGFLVGENEQIREFLHKSYKGVSVTYSLPQGQCEVSATQLFIRHTELERLQTVNDIAPDVSAGMALVEPWKGVARQYGEEFYQQNKRLSIRQIADKVAKKMADNGISGRGGKPLTAENIQREALIGLKSSKKPKNN